MKVVINNVEYIPKGEVPEITDESLKKCLSVLAEMVYFNQYHKMKGLAYNAIEALSPDLAKLDESEIYDRIKGIDD
ncbi:MAG: hypothetical protein Unbinned6284contig1001_43 [Prokaryotic dsDNA virus sp.]|nr:MAG: hypothetical protein Unbinned6284contig1001_43 [Prokaryotic dsDNA virus sp.]|tara:strand:+ start:8056 stop:8283 length:228 start_codon:yes stop_codon:yes gene_type:complete